MRPVTRLTTHTALLLTVLSGLVIGCSDTFLPPEEAEDTAKALFYVYDRPTPGVIPIGSGGPDGSVVRRPLIPLPGRLHAPLSTDNHAAVVDQNEVVVVDLGNARTIATLDGGKGTWIGSHSAAISPDGTQVGFAVSEPDAQAIDYSLHLINVDGTNRRVVDGIGPAEENFLRFSPDGTQVAFIDGGTYDTINGYQKGPYNLYVVETATGEARALAEIGSITHRGLVQIEWSPDGKQILYSEEDNTFQNWLIDVESGIKSFICQGFAQFDWSPDGNSILLTNTYELRVYDPENLADYHRVPIIRPVLFPRMIDNGSFAIGYVLPQVLDAFDFNIETDQVEIARISLQTGTITTLVPDQDVWYLFRIPISDQ